ncbi:MULTISPECIES: hypothetical protein [unclassified Nonomuraea]|uniref:hypothetical protein n=1 Tax=unclassified Nonomuraea TaxID=2593643 RepID=UPI0033E104DC
MIAQPVPPPAVRRERTLSASPRSSSRAWLDPDILRQRLAPGDRGARRLGGGWDGVLDRLMDGVRR